jgi:hypothetical protein
MRFDPQMITVTDHKDCPDTPPLAISPVLETGSTAPVSTNWMPLHELIAHWTEVDTLLLPAPVAPVLAAIGHALLALSGETSALRLSTLAWQHRERAPRGAALALEQAAHCLDRAAREWALAAGHLDSLSPTDVEQQALVRAQRLSRVARTQQARLWKLIAEIRADSETWLTPQQEKEVRGQARRSRSLHRCDTGNDERSEP